MRSPQQQQQRLQQKQPLESHSPLQPTHLPTNPPNSHPHRGFGGSDGEPRHWVSPTRHLQDWEAAFDFVTGESSEELQDPVQAEVFDAIDASRWGLGSFGVLLAGGVGWGGCVRDARAVWSGLRPFSHNNKAAPRIVGPPEHPSYRPPATRPCSQGCAVGDVVWWGPRAGAGVQAGFQGQGGGGAGGGCPWVASRGSGLLSSVIGVGVPA